MRIYSQNIGMEISIIVMRIGKQHVRNGMELPNQNKIRTLEEKDKYKFLGILEADTI